MNNNVLSQETEKQSEHVIVEFKHLNFEILRLAEYIDTAGETEENMSILDNIQQTVRNLEELVTKLLVRKIQLEKELCYGI